MPAYPQVSPPVGQNVQIELANGNVLIAYFDGLQWWAGVDGQDGDVPVVNNYVVSWQHIE